MSGKIVLGTLLLAACALAQTRSASITEPVLGLVFDGQTQTLRTLLGIPAAARMVGSMDTGAPLRAAVVSSELAYALGLEQDTGAAVLLSRSGRQAVTGLRSGGVMVAVSPRGTAAGVYFADSGKATILTGLPDAPQSVREVTLDGPPSLLAVSDDGTSLAASIKLSENEATVFSYSPESAGQSLLRDRQYVSLDYVPGSTVLLMAGENAVYRYQSRQGLQLLADQRDGIANLVGVAASLDGGQVFMAMRSGQVVVRNLAASTQTLLSCACQPAGLWRLRGKAVFRLSEPGGGPLWVVDGDAAAPRLLFVAMPGEDNR